MYYHVILLYILVILLIIATVYYDFIKKTPIKTSLFTESATDEIEVPTGGFSEDTVLFSYDNRYEKLRGKAKFYVKFKDVNKNNIIQVRIVDTIYQKLSEVTVLADERTAVIDLNLNKHIDFLRVQTKTGSETGNIKLERLEIEYNF